MTREEVENIPSRLLQHVRKGSKPALDHYRQLSTALNAYKSTLTVEKWADVEQRAQSALTWLPIEENPSDKNPPAAWTELEEAIRKAHGCDSEHIESVKVVEKSGRRIAWKGTVEVFRLIAHPKAQLAYGWTYEDGHVTRCTTVLGIPPVDSPQTAIKVGVARKTQDKPLNPNRNAGGQT